MIPEWFKSALASSYENGGSLQLSSEGVRELARAILAPEIEAIIQRIAGPGNLSPGPYGRLTGDQT